jgi:UV excision repair protein RAD23
MLTTGKILQDDKRIEEYMVKEDGFVICMVKETRGGSSTASPAPAPQPVAKAPEPAAAPSASTPATQPTTTTTASTTTTSITPVPASDVAGEAGNTQEPTATGASAATFNDPSAFATGSNRETAIQNMMEMGYPRDQCETALRAAFNNPDRAVEYLLSGIPEGLQRPAVPAAGAAAIATGGAADTAEVGPADVHDEEEGGEDESGQMHEDLTGVDLFAAAAQAQGGGQAGAHHGHDHEDEGGELDLSFLNSPQFHQIRQLIQQQPQMLEPALQQLMATFPQLERYLAQNPEAFLRFLRETAGDEEGDDGTVQIEITPEENEAINRLVELGFEREIVIQAYFACDKNEEVTANYLFEHGDEE